MGSVLILKDFQPSIFLRNRHFQTTLNSVGPRKVRANRLSLGLQSETIILKSPSGVRLISELDLSGANCKRLVVLIHGWEGSSKSAYQISAAKTLLDNGFDVLRLNLRDHGDSHHLNKQMFNATRSDEVADCIGFFLSTRSYEKVFIAGFSLGGNFALRIAADHGSHLELTAVVAISPPVDDLNGLRVLNKGFFVYRRYFFRLWKSSLIRKISIFPEYGIQSKLRQARSIDDINSILIPDFVPYMNPESYFSAYALTGDRLSTIKVPSTIIASKDDPIVPTADIIKICKNARLSIEIQAFGGHCGFIDNVWGASWVERRLSVIFNSFL